MIRTKFTRINDTRQESSRNLSEEQYLSKTATPKTPRRNGKSFSQSQQRNLAENSKMTQWCSQDMICDDDNTNKLKSGWAKKFF